MQAEYEVAPDEKRRECGQELIDKYFNPKVPDITMVCIRLFKMQRTQTRDVVLASWVQSEDHVPEVEAAMMAQCRDKLQREACKELFKDCTK